GWLLGRAVAGEPHGRPKLGAGVVAGHAPPLDDVGHVAGQVTTQGLLGAGHVTGGGTTDHDEHKGRGDPDAHGVPNRKGGAKARVPGRLDFLALIRAGFTTLGPPVPGVWGRAGRSVASRDALD